MWIAMLVNFKKAAKTGTAPPGASDGHFKSQLNTNLQMAFDRAL
jgi:hypothetical protein